MADEIVNRVANSKLVTIDLEDYYPQGQRSIIDISQWLYEGLILKEKEFRQKLKAHSWEQFQDHYVGLICSTEAIVPSWAFMLVSTHLKPFAKTVVIGDRRALESSIYQDIIQKLDIEEFRAKPLVIKGCTNKPIPENAYVMLANKLQDVASSIMYGEACSAVPLFKQPKK